jgi:hypothetical protein
MSKQDKWLAVPIVGIFLVNEVSVGTTNQVSLLRASKLDHPLKDELLRALQNSIQDWGLTGATIQDVHVLFMPLSDTSPNTIRTSLINGKIALSILSRKLFMVACPQYLLWDRQQGCAVGAVYQDNKWEAIRRPLPSGFTLVKSLPKNFWDIFFDIILKGGVDEVHQALLSNLEWERASLESSHDTHKFAFEWIALESGMMRGERDEGAFVKRFSLLAAAPSQYYWTKIQKDPSAKLILDGNKNPYTKEWQKAIKEMYKYRCAILHDGAVDTTSVVIDTMKVDWFWHLAEHLNARLVLLLVDAIIKNIHTLNDVWESHAVNFMYSPDNHWIQTKTFIDKFIINHDWKKSKLR